MKLQSPLVLSSLSKKLIIVCAIIGLILCLPVNSSASSSSKDSSVSEASQASIPSGAYKLEKSHASLIFKVNHLGFSNYVMRFKSFDADLQFDLQNPTKSEIVATIDPTSIETDYPDSKKLNFNAKLQDQNWMNVAAFPRIVFTSKKIEMTGDKTANVIGELDLHGVKKSITLKTTFNGGYAGHPMDPNARIGFSAQGSFNRSDFGIKYGIPAAGSSVGVGDNVEFEIEAEFIKPADKKSSDKKSN